MERVFFAAGAIFAFLAVTAGAFGAHLLKGRLSSDLLDIFETGIRYQMYHSLALFAVSWFQSRCPSKWIRWSGWLFISGIVLFSGSLYVLVFTDQRWLGAITPLGGTSFLAGWLCLSVAVLRFRS